MNAYLTCYWLSIKKWQEVYSLREASFWSRNRCLFRLFKFLLYQSLNSIKWKVVYQKVTLFDRANEVSIIGINWNIRKYLHNGVSKCHKCKQICKRLLNWFEKKKMPMYLWFIFDMLSYFFQYSINCNKLLPVKSW